MRWDQPSRPQYLWKSGWWPRRGEGAVGSRRAVFRWTMCRGEPSEGISRARMWRPIFGVGQNGRLWCGGLAGGEGVLKLAGCLLQNPVQIFILEARSHCYGWLQDEE